MPQKSHVLVVHFLLLLLLNFKVFFTVYVRFAYHMQKTNFHAPAEFTVSKLRFFFYEFASSVRCDAFLPKTERNGQDC